MSLLNIIERGKVIGSILRKNSLEKTIIHRKVEGKRKCNLFTKNYSTVKCAMKAYQLYNVKYFWLGSTEITKCI